MIIKILSLHTNVEFTLSYLLKYRKSAVINVINIMLTKELHAVNKINKLMCGQTLNFLELVRHTHAWYYNKV